MAHKKARGPLTDEEKYQQALLQEKDLVNLLRKYTIYESDRIRNQYTSGTVLVRGNKIQKIFEDELADIRADLNIATTREKKVADAKIMQKISDLVDEYKFYTDEVNINKIQTHEIEGQIKIVKKRIIELTKLQTTDLQHLERIRNAMKTVAKLENTLELQTKKFCIICAKNRALREEIQHLCKLRSTFMIKWDFFINKLSFGRQIILDLIEQATLAFDQREEWCMKLKALKIKAAQDLNKSKVTLKMLYRADDNNQKLIDFMSTKSQRRVMRMLMKKERTKRMLKQDQLRDKLKEYHVMMMKITNFVRDDDVNSIEKKFYYTEQNNFSRFRYIIDLIKEMEDYGDNLGFLHIDIDQERILHEERFAQQQERLSDVEVDLKVKTEARKQQETILNQLSGQLKTMMSGVATLFKICKCKNDPLIKLLGDNRNVETYNVILYLQILESTLQRLLVKAHLRDKILLEKHKIASNQALIYVPMPPVIFSITEIVDSDPCPLCIERDVVVDAGDIVSCVYTKEYAQKKVKKRMKKADGAATLHRVSKCMLPKSREIMQRRLIN